MSLLSLEFWALASVATILLTSLRGLARHAAFLTANLLFIWALLGAAGTATTVLFCLLGYLIIHLTRSSNALGLYISVTAYLALFVYMQNYDFLGILLPDEALFPFLSTIGLSFLFFKILHVMIEARSNTLGPLNFPTYFNYCLNFTTFMMGPIQRYQDFYRQWHDQRVAIPLRFEAHLDSVIRILVGLIKAYVVAKAIFPHTLSGASDVAELSRVQLLIGAYAFYIYLYLNFSGYCDVVIALGSIFGIRPPENFNMPFVARNVSDFWLRFHRSLTSWLTDYVFSPLYKWHLTNQRLSAHPLLSANIALLTTMFICGLWHGTTMSFIVFGILHGMFQVIYRTWDTLFTRQFGRKWVQQHRRKLLPHLVGVFITFNAVSIAFIFFQLDVETGLEVVLRLLRL